MSDTEHETSEAAALEARIRRRQTIRVVVVVVPSLIFAAIALDNTQDVAIGWVVDDVKVPLIVALVLSFLTGALVASVLALRYRRSIRRSSRDD